MGKRGPQPKPTNLKLLQGIPGKRPLNVNEPKPKIKIPDMPRGLGTYGKTEWQRITKVLNDLKLISEVDKTQLESYCRYYNSYREACKKVDEQGAVVTNVQGNLVANPWNKVMNDAYDRMNNVMKQFGMSPSTRTTLTVEKEEAKSPLEKIFASKKQ